MNPLVECPFCTHTSRVPAVIREHVQIHDDDDGNSKTVQMLIEGCYREGNLGGIWAHYIAAHVDQVPAPSKVERARKADVLEDAGSPTPSKLIKDFFGVKKRKRLAASSMQVPRASGSGSSSSSFLIHESVAIRKKLRELTLLARGAHSRGSSRVSFVDLGESSPPGSPPVSSSPSSSSSTLVSDAPPIPAQTTSLSVVTLPASFPTTAPTVSIALVSLNLDTALIFQGYPSSTAIFKRLNDVMGSVVRGCVFHVVMTGGQSSDHSELWRCTAGLLGKNSEFKKGFTLKLRAQYSACCFDCWTPQDQAFKHGPDRCKLVGRSQWESWWRAVPYLVFRTTYLRVRVFLALGLSEGAFSSIDLYADWLTSPAQSLADPDRDIRITNLIAVMFVYFRLRTEGKLKGAGVGLGLDKTLLSVKWIIARNWIAQTPSQRVIWRAITHVTSFVVSKALPPLSLHLPTPRTLGFNEQGERNVFREIRLSKPLLGVEAGPAYSLTTTTRFLKFHLFDLGRALEEDNKCRIEVVGEEFSLEDEDIEFEDVMDSGARENMGEGPGLTSVTLTPSSSDSLGSQPPSFPQLDPLPSLTQHLGPIALKGFDMSSLPAGSNGWTASPTSKLSPGLKKLWRDLNLLSASSLRMLDWDGVSRRVLLDKSDRIIAVLGGVPPGSEGEDWEEKAEQALRAVDDFREQSTFS
ncbi:hypothetical protein EV368DRAFT_69740 [Lentinula lateritia]|nr:hypothetical protein EV368DRAFT_69740 [Lentinula lateritia]